MSSVGIELVNEIARVTSIADSWQKDADQLPPRVSDDMRLSIFIMRAEVERAKAALHGDDPIAAIRCYQSLKDYSDD